MRLLDLFCKAGGGAMGYHQAGFDEIVGVDIEDQPNYPFTFVKGDALEACKWFDLSTFDLIHASPPCQAYTKARRLYGRSHPDLIGPVRDLIESRPYVVENVPGSPLIAPTVLDGVMFGLGTKRERWFETNWDCKAPGPGGFMRHPPSAPHARMGRPPQPDELMHVVGHFSGVAQAREAMGIDWMTQDELREAIPPAFTRFIGEAFIAQMTRA